jgi:hypothetical protein
MKEKIKKFLKIFFAVLIIVLFAFGIFLLITSKGINTGNKHFCTEQSRNAEACIEIYSPVCGYPSAKTYGNSCFACMEKFIEYYTEGEC